MDNDNILQFNGNTTEETSPDDVLEAAKGQLEQVVLIGVTKDGLTYYASNTSDIGAILLELRLFESEMIRIIKDGE